MQENLVQLLKSNRDMICKKQRPVGAPSRSQVRTTQVPPLRSPKQVQTPPSFEVQGVKAKQSERKNKGNTKTNHIDFKLSQNLEELHNFVKDQQQDDNDNLPSSARDPLLIPPQMRNSIENKNLNITKYTDDSHNSSDMAGKSKENHIVPNYNNPLSLNQCNFLDNKMASFDNRDSQNKDQNLVNQANLAITYQSGHGPKSGKKQTDWMNQHDYFNNNNHIVGDSKDADVGHKNNNLDILIPSEIDFEKGIDDLSAVQNTLANATEMNNPSPPALTEENTQQKHTASLNSQKNVAHLSYGGTGILKMQHPLNVNMQFTSALTTQTQLICQPQSSANTQSNPPQVLKQDTGQRETIKLKQPVINLEEVMSQEQVRHDNYQAMSRRSQRVASLRKQSVEGKKSIRIQVSTLERGGSPQVIEGLWDDQMSKSNSQVDTNVGPSTPFNLPTNTDILPVIEINQEQSYRQLKQKEFKNNQLSTQQLLNYPVCRVIKSPQVQLNKNDLFDIKNIQEISQYVLESQRIKLGQQNEKGQDMTSRLKTKTDSFVLQTSFQTYKQNQFTNKGLVKKQQKPVRKQYTPFFSDQPPESSDIRVTKSTNWNEQKHGSNKNDDNQTELVLNSQKLVINQPASNKLKSIGKQPGQYIKRWKDELACLQIDTENSQVEHFDFREPETAGIPLELSPKTSRLNNKMSLLSDQKSNDENQMVIKKTQSKVKIEVQDQKTDVKIQKITQQLNNTSDCVGEPKKSCVQSPEKQQVMALVHFTSNVVFEDQSKAKTKKQQGSIKNKEIQQTTQKTSRNQANSSQIKRSPRKQVQKEDIFSKCLSTENTEQEFQRMHAKIDVTDSSSNENSSTERVKPHLIQPKQPYNIESSSQLVNRISTSHFKKRESVFGQIADTSSQDQNKLPQIQTHVKILKENTAILDSKQPLESKIITNTSSKNSVMITKSKRKKSRNPELTQGAGPGITAFLPTRSLKKDDEDFHNYLKANNGNKSIVQYQRGSFNGTATAVIGESFNILSGHGNVKTSSAQQVKTFFKQRSPQTEALSSGANHIQEQENDPIVMETEEKLKEIEMASQMDLKSAKSIINYDLSQEKPQSQLAINHSKQQQFVFQGSAGGNRGTLPFNELALVKIEVKPSQNQHNSSKKYLSKIDKKHETRVVATTRQVPRVEINKLEHASPFPKEQSSPEESETARPKDHSSMDLVSSVDVAANRTGFLNSFKSGSRHLETRNFDQFNQNHLATQLHKNLKIERNQLQIQRQKRKSVVSPLLGDYHLQSLSCQVSPGAVDRFTHPSKDLSFQQKLIMKATGSYAKNKFKATQFDMDQDKQKRSKGSNQETLFSQLDSKQTEQQNYQRQNIIDYPRYIRFSSNFESVSQIQTEMRRQRIFHKEFSPSFCSDKNQAILEGVYIPNRPVLKSNAETYVNEFIRAKGNLQHEPTPKPKSQLIKVYGKPTLKPDTLVNKQNNKQTERQQNKRLKPQSLDEKYDQLESDGVENTNQCEQQPQKSRINFSQKEWHAKKMLNYARNLVIEKRTNITQDIEPHLRFDKLQILNDLMTKIENPAGGNAKSNFLNHKRAIQDKLDNGYQIEVALKDKWHPTQRQDLEFVNRINTTSMESMVFSFKKLLKPREVIENNTQSRLYDDQIRLPGYQKLAANQGANFSRKAQSVKQSLRQSHDVASEHQLESRDRDFQIIHNSDAIHKRNQSNLPFSKAKLISQRLIPHYLSSRSKQSSNFKNIDSVNSPKTTNKLNAGAQKSTMASFSVLRSGQ